MRLLNRRDRQPDQLRQSGGIQPPSRPAANETVSVKQALSYGPVYRAISLINASVAQMTLQVKANGYVIAAPAIVRRPNPSTNSSAFVQQTVYSLAAHGESFWRVRRRQSDDQPVSVEVMDPTIVTVSPRYDQSGVLVGRDYTVAGRTLRPSSVRHLELLRRPGQTHAVSPIDAGRAEIAAALRLREFANQWFSTSGVPTGYLTTDQVLGPAESERYAKAWKQFLRDNDGMGVLSQGLQYTHVNLDPEKAQFVDVQKAAVVNIARLFGIPAPLLLAEIDSTSMTYENMANANLRFLQTTLTRYMGEIEASFTDLLPRGQVARFNQDDLLRMDPTRIAETDAVLVNAKLRTVNELRARDGLRPIDDERSTDG